MGNKHHTQKVTVEIFQEVDSLLHIKKNEMRNARNWNTFWIFITPLIICAIQQTNRVQRPIKIHQKSFFKKKSINEMLQRQFQRRFIWLTVGDGEFSIQPWVESVPAVPPVRRLCCMVWMFLRALSTRLCKILLYGLT